MRFKAWHLVRKEGDWAGSGDEEPAGASGLWYEGHCLGFLRPEPSAQQRGKTNTERGDPGFRGFCR